MSLQREKLENIIKDNALNELKKFFCDEKICNSYVDGALEYTVEYGILNIFKYILNNYSDKITDKSLNKSLQYASLYGKLNIVKYILKNYSSKITDKSINTSLLNATDNGKLNIVKYIEFYRFIKNNTVIYKKTVIFNF